MVWYYMKGRHRHGPISDEAFHRMAAEGDMHGETLVWRPGMGDWAPLQSLGAALTSGGQAGANLPHPCVECKKPFPASEMVQLHRQWICTGCKQRYLMRIREGVQRPMGVPYARFWRRAVAKVLDYGLLGIYANLFSMLAGLMLYYWEWDAVIEFGVAMILVLLSIIIQAMYNTWFIGKYGATLGKMAMGIKVIMPDGARVTYMRAFGRYLMEHVSGALLYLGYVFAAYDDRYRTLHDMACDTRVVLDVHEEAATPDIQSAMSFQTAGETS